MQMMHLGVIILSILLITLITLDTLRNVSFLADSTYLRVQFWCCLFFIADVFVEMSFAPKKWKYLWHHTLFLLISIPYLNIIHHFNIPVDAHIQYMLRFVPMIRTAYVFTIVTGATASARWAKNMTTIFIVFSPSFHHFLLFQISGLSSGKANLTFFTSTELRR